MVLCPFVHLVMRFDIIPLALQPSEVHSAHWVPLRALLSPYLSTFTSTDVSGRFGQPTNYFFRGFARLLFGRILMKAVDLVPTESIYCSSSLEFRISKHGSATHGLRNHSRWFTPATAWQKQSLQLTLWGLTLGKLDLRPTLVHCSLAGF